MILIFEGLASVQTKAMYDIQGNFSFLFLEHVIVLSNTDGCVHTYYTESVTGRLKN